MSSKMAQMSGFKEKEYEPIVQQIRLFTMKNRV
jgi:hypothetical protein